MRTCDYCGKENEESLTRCAECGTELRAQETPQPQVPGAPRVLDAKNATIILVITYAAQVLAAIVVVLLAALFEHASDRNFPRSAAEELRAIMPVFALVATIASGTAMWVTTNKFKIPFTDTSPTGAAWVIGSHEAVIKGIGIGMLISFGSQLILHLFSRHTSYRDVDELTRMAFTPGLPRVLYVIAAVFLAPPIEEMLFRGLLFGGFCKSVGFHRAAIGTTAIFVLLHAAALITQPLATFGITAMAIAALWMRVRHQAIGAAIAVHFGYNFLATLHNLMLR